MTHWPSVVHFFSTYWPFVVLLLCVGLVVFLITVVRLHAFLALILAAIAAGLLAGPLPGEPKKSHATQAIELTTAEFGVTAGKIGVVIALASVIGMCLMESGAADKVVRRFLAIFGEKRAGFVLLLSSYILSIPIFFDTFFMLLLPVAQALALRLRKNYLLFLMAICCSAIVPHIVVAPHPGPLAMAETLKLDLGLTIVVGLGVGIVPALCAWMVAHWLNRRTTVAFRQTPGTSVARLEQVIASDERALPGFLPSILPVLLPIGLISTASFMTAFAGAKRIPVLYPCVEFIGNRNVALVLGAAIAMWVLARQKGYSVAKVCSLIGRPLETAGVIILITSAGGAFGSMLKNAGVGDAIKAASAGREVNFVLLAWLVSSVIRVAQGSATVAMLTTSAMMVPIIYPQGGEGLSGLPYHPIYIFLAIGFGSIILSWMNDSGFWVVSKLSGMTERETLQSWTVITTVVSVSGLLVTLLGAAVFPCGGQ
jgi:GntP family gluconate:H+ symporter